MTTLKPWMPTLRPPKLPKRPFVSVCCVTFNRRPFIPFMLKCFQHQTYPRDKMELIIVDDGTDPIGDLVKDFPYIKYVRIDNKMTLGAKRNLSHTYAIGDLIAYADDDDFYPSERIAHAVKMLQDTPKAWVAGSSEMHIFFKHIGRTVQFGPYGPNHATAATFCFHKELLQYTQYEETASIAEEKQFLKQYTIPMVQLDTLKTILVFSHMHNSFDKKVLLEEENKSPFIKPSPYTVDDFISDPELKQFYMCDIDTYLRDYRPGDLTHKPDVVRQLNEIKEKRAKMASEMAAQMERNAAAQMQTNAAIQRIMMTRGGGPLLPPLPKPPHELMAENTEMEKKLAYLQKKIADMGGTVPPMASPQRHDIMSINAGLKAQMATLEAVLKEQIRLKIAERTSR